MTVGHSPNVYESFRCVMVWRSPFCIRYRHCDGSGNILQGRFAIYMDVTLILTTYFSIVGNHLDPFKETCSPDFPDLNQVQHLWGVLDKPVPYQNLHLASLNEQLLTSWCQIPQHTFKAQNVITVLSRLQKLHCHYTIISLVYSAVLRLALLTISLNMSSVTACTTYVGVLVSLLFM